MPYADHARNVVCDQRYRRTEARRSSWRAWYHRQDKRSICRLKLARLRAKKRELHRRDGWRCHYCGTRGTMATLTQDHKIPRKDGGRSTLNNLVSACRSCNQRKGTKPYDVFVERMRAERGLVPLWVEEESAFTVAPAPPLGGTKLGGSVQAGAR